MLSRCIANNSDIEAHRVLSLDLYSAALCLLVPIPFRIMHPADVVQTVISCRYEFGSSGITASRFQNLIRGVVGVDISAGTPLAVELRCCPSAHTWRSMGSYKWGYK